LLYCEFPKERFGKIWRDGLGRFGGNSSSEGFRGWLGVRELVGHVLEKTIIRITDA